MADDVKLIGVCATHPDVNGCLCCALDAERARRQEAEAQLQEVLDQLAPPDVLGQERDAGIVAARVAGELKGLRERLAVVAQLAKAREALYYQYAQLHAGMLSAIHGSSGTCLNPNCVESRAVLADTDPPA